MIDEQSAIEIARAAAAEQQWAFGEPVECVVRRSWLRGRPMRWEIRSSAGSRGSVSRFVIDANDGRILERGYVPR
jgi:hypothetical protein